MLVLRLLYFSLYVVICHSATASFKSGRTYGHDSEAEQTITFSLTQEYTLADDGSPNYEDNSAQATFNSGDFANEATRTSPISLQVKPTTVWRPRDPEALQYARIRSLKHDESVPVEWEPVEILGPNVEDRHTLGQLARMTGNAYALPGQKNWYDIDQSWNTSFPFGWEDAADGFRGHIFVSPMNSTVVLSIKGTTLQGPTSKKDKFNDNLLFSCCCAYVDLSWIFKTVCGCHRKKFRCDNTCLSEALIEDSLFYNIGVNLITNVTAMYPESTIWLVGHSLGGALASLLGTTFGLPAVAFESPGERLAAHRLHLPLPPLSSAHPFSPPLAIGSPPPCPNAPVTHVYHTADPIPQGTCTGVGSACVAGGFALETRCHLGKSIVYDTVTKLGWKADVRKHPIREVIINVVEKIWDIGLGWEVDERGMIRDVPKARVEEDCVDCFKWEFGDFEKKSDLLL